MGFLAPFTELKPVKKFTDRKSAVARIWAVAQRLRPDGASQASDVAPANEGSKKSLTKLANRPRAKPSTKGAEDRTNKKAEVIAMIKRAKGATLAEIMEATGWQAHTVRGFVKHPGQQGWDSDFRGVISQNPVSGVRGAVPPGSRVLMRQAMHSADDKADRFAKAVLIGAYTMPGYEKVTCAANVDGF